MSADASRNRPFSGLSPDVVLAAVAQLGLQPDGRLLALNSYENRVYRVGIEPEAEFTTNPFAIDTAVVAKFYREGRWSDPQIREEHAFALELAAAELPVAAPLLRDGESLHSHREFRFAVFACWRGSAPELDLPEHRAMLGRTLGRLHAVGAQRRFVARPSVDVWQCGAAARRQLLAAGMIPPALEDKYAAVSAQLVEAVRARWDYARAARWQRLHGDCHLGNILWNAQGPVFVDLDDCLGGPVVQDLWMLCSGSPAQQQREWAEIMAGYSQFADFEQSQLSLVEPLRAVRMINHAAWIAARWQDPAFPRAFPWFGEVRYWENHVTELHEQLETIEDPPLLRLC